jgi:hypothetical protein
MSHESPPPELDALVKAITDWAPAHTGTPEALAVADTLDDLLVLLRGADEDTTRHQVRTAFSAAELHRIDSVRGVVRRSSWVRGMVEDVVLGRTKIAGSGGSPAPADEEKLHRMTFWMRDELLTSMDQLRGALTRSGWVRDTILRVLG